MTEDEYIAHFPFTIAVSTANDGRELLVSESERGFTAYDKWTLLKSGDKHTMSFVFFFKESVEFKLRFG